MANTTNFSIEKASVGGARNSWGGISNLGIDKIDELLALAMPLGTIQMYPLSTAPTQTTNGGTWLICDGGSLAQVGDYAALYAIIGTTYGTGSSVSGTFSLPDLRARVPVGYNVAAISAGTVGVRSIRVMASTTDGTEAHILAGTQIPKHLHPITDPGHIHPIDPATTHSHVGDQTDGKTGSASAVINDPSHTHDLGKGGTYSSSGTDGEAQSYSYNSTEFMYHYAGAERATGGKVSGVTDTGHAHSLTTDAKVTGITTTETNPIRITTTGLQTDGDASHNNMQPYITVQYIILAKHPTF
jgi:microcystin-dependent protein